MKGESFEEEKFSPNTKRGNHCQWTIFQGGKNLISLTKKRIFCNWTNGSCGSFTFPSPFKKLPLTQFESKE